MMTENEPIKHRRKPFEKAPHFGEKRQFTGFNMESRGPVSEAFINSTLKERLEEYGERGIELLQDEEAVAELYRIAYQTLRDVVSQGNVRGDSAVWRKLAVTTADEVIRDYLGITNGVSELGEPIGSVGPKDLILPGSPPLNEQLPSYDPKLADSGVNISALGNALPNNTRGSRELTDTDIRDITGNGDRDDELMNIIDRDDMLSGDEDQGYIDSRETEEIPSVREKRKSYAGPILAALGIAAAGIVSAGMIGYLAGRDSNRKKQSPLPVSNTLRTLEIAVDEVREQSESNKTYIEKTSRKAEEERKAQAEVNQVLNLYIKSVEKSVKSLEGKLSSGFESLEERFSSFREETGRNISGVVESLNKVREEIKKAYNESVKEKPAEDYATLDIIEETHLIEKTETKSEPGVFFKYESPDELEQVIKEPYQNKRLTISARYGITVPVSVKERAPDNAETLEVEVSKQWPITKSLSGGFYGAVNFTQHDKEVNDGAIFGRIEEEMITGEAGGFMEGRMGDWYGRVKLGAGLLSREADVTFGAYGNTNTINNKYEEMKAVGKVGLELGYYLTDYIKLQTAISSVIEGGANVFQSVDVKAGAGFSFSF